MNKTDNLRITISKEDYFRCKQRCSSTSSPLSSDDDNESEDRTVPFTLSPLDHYRGSRKPTRPLEGKKKNVIYAK
jgi:hypothetical protein